MDKTRPPLRDFVSLSTPNPRLKPRAIVVCPGGAIPQWRDGHGFNPIKIDMRQPRAFFRVPFSGDLKWGKILSYHSSMTRVSVVMKFLCSLLLLLAVGSLHAAETRPNIVWLIGEDMGPELGCYGDTNAITPNMDRLARERGALHALLHARAGLRAEPFGTDHRAISHDHRHASHAFSIAQAAADVHRVFEKSGLHDLLADENGLWQNRF